MDGYPAYSYPSSLLGRVARDVILLRRRDFHADAKACIDNLNPSLQIWGREHIPRQGPCVLTVNHYHRPGFEAQWLALAISAAVPVGIHWVMTGEFMYQGKWYTQLEGWASRILLKRIAQIYGFTTMPPMPPRPGDVAVRAAAVRAVLRYVKCAKEPVLGLAPEGFDPPTAALMQPPNGLGRFGLLLSKAGLTFSPVGAYESKGVFHLHFGARYYLRVGNDLPTDDKEACAMNIIMKKIADLLPAPLRGEFA
jgi:hypothetical protein